MKKIIYIFICLITVVPIVSGEDKVFEGFDGMPWGTTIEEFKNKVSNVINLTTPDHKAANQSVFVQVNKKGESVGVVYFFFDNKLFKGRLGDRASEEMLIKIFTELINTYGMYDEQKEEKDSLNYYWKNSPQFHIVFKYFKKQNNFINIDYYNPKIVEESNIYKERSKLNLNE